MTRTTCSRTLPAMTPMIACLDAGTEREMADDKIEIFKEQHPSVESYWRSIILFGRNVASYKFALAESLVELGHEKKTDVTLEELAEPFSRHLCYHIKNAPKQTTSSSSTFLDTCVKYNEGQIDKDELIDVTVKRGFNNVIDAFHNVNNEPIDIKFYEKDYEAGSKRIILTDNIFLLDEKHYLNSLKAEVESRWNLVETAWELGISRSLLNVDYDDDTGIFYVDKALKRKDVTSAAGSLNGYQKGRCFYCFDDISRDNILVNDLYDVDHFFPHALQKFYPDINFDGVWNLVLACRRCNRGEGGKFASVPSLKYLERLHRRNEFLINSHHPLRETIISQTGRTEAERRDFLAGIDHMAIDVMMHRWETEQLSEAVF